MQNERKVYICLCVCICIVRYIQRIVLKKEPSKAEVKHKIPEINQSKSTLSS